MDDDFNDDHFEEYNPHPYLGGYDISRTYGSPLPHSDAICYPISSLKPDAPPLLPRTMTPPVVLPDERLERDDFGESGLDPRPEPFEPHPVVLPEERRDPGDFGEAGFDYPQPEPDKPHPVVLPEERPDPGYFGESGFNYPQPEPYLTHPFGYWPFETMEEERRLYGYDGRGCEVEEMGDWRNWKRAADYLFGYSHGYGERRIGADSYGVPIYANKKHGYDQALSLELKPAQDYQVEQWSSAYDERKEESFTYENTVPILSYERHHHFEQPLHVHVEPIEPSWTTQRLITYHEAYEEQGYPETNSWSSSHDERKDESNLYGVVSYSNDVHTYEQPLHVQLESFEPVWSRQTNYSDAYVENSSPKSNWFSSFHDDGVNGKHFDDNTNHGYAKHHYEQPRAVELEPYEPSWSRYPSYYGFSNNEDGASFRDSSDQFSPF